MAPGPGAAHGPQGVRLHPDRLRALAGPARDQRADHRARRADPAGVRVSACAAWRCCWTPSTRCASGSTSTSSSKASWPPCTTAAPPTAGRCCNGSWRRSATRSTRPSSPRRSSSPSRPWPARRSPAWTRALSGARNHRQLAREVIASQAERSEAQVAVRARPAGGLRRPPRRLPAGTAAARLRHPADRPQPRPDPPRRIGDPPATGGRGRLRRGRRGGRRRRRGQGHRRRRDAPPPRPRPVPAAGFTAGPLTTVVAAQIVFLAHKLLFPDAFGLAFLRPSDVLRGQFEAGFLSQLLLSIAVGLLGFGLVSLLPIPPLDGFGLLWSAQRRRRRHAGLPAVVPGEEHRRGRPAGLLLFPLTHPLLLIPVDVLGTIFFRLWAGRPPLRRRDRCHPGDRFQGMRDGKQLRPGIRPARHRPAETSAGRRDDERSRSAPSDLVTRLNETPARMSRSAGRRLRWNTRGWAAPGFG